MQRFGHRPGRASPPRSAPVFPAVESPRGASSLPTSSSARARPDDRELTPGAGLRASWVGWTRDTSWYCWVSSPPPAPGQAGPWRLVSAEGFDLPRVGGGAGGPAGAGSDTAPRLESLGGGDWR